ncbi:MAG: YicC/YloC family endoribonuclease [Halioglobus sp.]
MTAFARESEPTDQGVVTIEVRTVNHRYLDCTFKMPDSMRASEHEFRELAGKSLSRGKLECMIRVQQQSNQAGSLQIDEEQLAHVLSLAADIATKVENVQPLNPLEVLQFPGVSQAQSVSEDLLPQAAKSLLPRVLESLVSNRKREGDKLAQLILDRIEKVEQEVALTRQRLPDLMQAQRERVIGKISELDIDVDQGRLEQELVFMAQKADVDEELDRLEAHISEVRGVIKKGGPCGRRLDFLMQELNREANTLSSKSTSSGTTQSAVELKVLIEQMREQIQNIE